MYTLESLPLIHVWLDADQLATTARILMDGYKVPAIGVVDSNRKLIGWVTALQLVGASSDTRLADILVPAPVALPFNMPVRDAAGEILKQDSDCIPVVKNGRYMAAVTTRHLLGKLRESYDPMTELPWSDALREWGIAKLEENVEIVILFIDLNSFGQFNKQFGHVIGDRVIQKVASHVWSKIDPSKDILVRYGGDEFAIGTIRDRDEAEELMESIQGDGGGLSVENVPVPVSFTIGIYGGRRTKARNNVHGASNLDNLVNLASRDCMAKKETLSDRAPERAPVPDTETSEDTEEPISHAVVSAPLPVIETIQADDEPNSLTYVVIRVDDKLFVGVSPKMGHSKAESVAIATGKALEKAYPETKVTIDSVNVERAGSTELVTTQVRTIRDKFERDVTAQAEANGDLDETVGLAVISAYLAE